MITQKIFSNIEQALWFYEKLGEYAAKDISRALNRANMGIRTDVNRHLAKTRDVRREDMKNWVFIKSTPAKLQAQAIIKGPRLGFEKLVKKRSIRIMDGKQKSGGLIVNIKGERTAFRHAFLHDRRKKDNRGKDPMKIFAWQRKRGAKNFNHAAADETVRLKGRHAWMRLKTQSVPQMADDPDVDEYTTIGAQDRFLKQLNHLVDQRVKGFNR